MIFQRRDGSIYEIKFHSINEYRKLKILFIVNLMLKWIVCQQREIQKNLILTLKEPNI